MLCLIAVLAFPAALAGAQEPVEIRITWYDDGNESERLRDLLDRFEAENPDIRVVVDVVPYTAILENLPLQLETGEGPDIARVTDLGGLSQYYLDMTPPADPRIGKKTLARTCSGCARPSKPSVSMACRTSYRHGHVYQPHAV